MIAIISISAFYLGGREGGEGLDFVAHHVIAGLFIGSARNRRALCRVVLREGRISARAGKRARRTHELRGMRMA